MRKSISIYLMKSALTGLVKIGYSENVKRRIRAIRAIDNTVEILFQSAPNRTIDDEETLHYMLRRYRVHGEWFRLSPMKIKFAIGFLYPL